MIDLSNRILVQNTDSRTQRVASPLALRGRARAMEGLCFEIYTQNIYLNFDSIKALINTTRRAPRARQSGFCGTVVESNLSQCFASVLGFVFSKKSKLLVGYLPLATYVVLVLRARASNGKHLG